MNPALNTAVERATREIIAGALRWKVSGGRVVSRPVNSPTAETSAIVGFMGSVEGTLTLKCTRRVVAEATRAMLGVDAAAGSAELRDAVGELLNMVVGQAKTYFSEDGESFSFTLPTTVMGDDYQVHVSAGPGARVAAIYFLCPVGPLSVEVYLKR